MIMEKFIMNDFLDVLIKLIELLTAILVLKGIFQGRE